MGLIRVIILLLLACSVWADPPIDTRFSQYFMRFAIDAPTGREILGITNITATATNVAVGDLLQSGATEGQIIEWNTTSNSWVVADNTGDHDPVSLTGVGNYLTLGANQVLTKAAINLAADVTGTLDESKIDADIARDSELHSAVTLSNAAADFIVLTNQNLTTRLISSNDLDSATWQAATNQVDQHDAVTLDNSAAAFLTLSDQALTTSLINSQHIDSATWQACTNDTTGSGVTVTNYSAAYSVTVGAPATWYTNSTGNYQAIQIWLAGTASDAEVEALWCIDEPSFSGSDTYDWAVRQRAYVHSGESHVFSMNMTIAPGWRWYVYESIATVSADSLYGDARVTEYLSP